MAEFPTISWEIGPIVPAELRPFRNANGVKSDSFEGNDMLARILGAIAGEKVAGPNSKLSGALVGAAIPAIARRGLGPLGLALAAGYGAKKFLEYRRSRGKTAA